jgi:hypothetical protein
LKSVADDAYAKSIDYGKWITIYLSSNTLQDATHLTHIAMKRWALPKCC